MVRTRLVLLDGPHGAPNDPFSGWGLKAAHGLVTDKIIVRAGKNGTATDPAIAGGSWVGAWSQNQVNARFRLKVWKLKGRIAGSEHALPLRQPVTSSPCNLFK